MQTEQVINYQVYGGEQRKLFFVPTIDPNKGATTSAALGTACAALIGLAVIGGVPIGAGAPTSANVQVDLKVTPILAKSGRGEIEKKESNEALLSPWTQDIEWIRFHSDVSVSALASVFDVTRKAFYGWMSGDVAPRPHRVARVSALRSALALLSTREERSAVFGLLDRKIESGATIRGILASNFEDEIALGRLSDAIREINPQIEKAAERASRSGAKSRAFESDFPSA
jgi:hypothetical protein